MKDERKTKAQLIEELNALRAALAEKEGKPVENFEGFIEIEGKQANLQLLFDQSPIEIIAYKDDQIVYANPASISGSGYQRLDEILGKSLLDFIHPDHYEKLKDRKDQFLSGKQSMPTTYQVIRKDGKPRWLEVNTIAVQIDGSPATLTFGYDISERLQAEQVLKSSEERLKQITDISTDWAYVIDYDSKGNPSNRWRSDSATRLTGYDHNALTQAVENQNIIHPEDKRLFEERLERLQANHEDTSEYRIITKAGETRWISDHALPIWDKKEKRVVRIYGGVKDITEQKESTAQLEKQNAILNEAEKLGNFGSFEWDIIKDKCTVSAGWQKIHGIYKRHFSSQDLLPIAHPDDQEMIQQAWDDAIIDNRPYNLEHRVIHQETGETRHIKVSGKMIHDNTGKPVWMLGSVQDITAQNESIAQLEKQNAILNEAEKLGNFGSFEWDIIRDKYTVSEGWQKIHGIYKRHFSSQDLLPIAHPDDQEMIQQAWKDTIENKSSYNLEHRIINQETGKTHWIKVSGKFIWDDAGKPLKIYGSGIDITEQKEAQKALQESEARFRGMFEQAAVGAAEVESKTNKLLRVNQRYTDIIGYSKEKLETMDFVQFSHPDDIKEDLDNMARLMAGEIHEYSMEKRIFSSTGETLWINLTVSPLWAPGEEPSRHIAIIEDITKRKQAEAELQRAYRNLNDAQRIGKSGNWEWNLQTGKIWWSDGLYNIYGRDSELGPPENNGFTECVHPDDQNMLIQALADSLISGLYLTEYRIKCDKTDETKIISSVGEVILDDEGTPLIHRGVSRDVTMQRRQEKALHESETKYANLFNNSLDAFLITNDEGQYIDVNPAACELLGYTRQQLLKLNVADITAPEELDNFGTLWREYLETGRQSGNYQVIRKDGNRVDVHYQAVSDILPGIHFSALRDISKQKQAELALRESEEKYRRLFDSSAMGIGYYDKEGTIVSFNQVAAKRMGGNPDDFIGNKLIDLFPESGELYQNRIDQVIHTGQSIEYEDLAPLPTGNKWFLSTYAPVNNQDSETIGVQIISQDITERKQAEEALQKSEERFRSLARLAPAGIYLTDEDGKCVFVNEKWMEMAGLNMQQAAGDGWKNGIHPEDRQYVFDNWDKLIGSKGRWNLEYRFKNQDDVTTWVRGVAAPQLDKDGTVIGYIGVNLDITEQKQAEIALRQSEASLREVLDASPFPVVLVDEQDDEVKFWSQSAKELFGHTAPTAGEWYQLVYPDPDYQTEVREQWIPARDKAKQTGKQVNAGDYQVTCKDGSVRICELYVAFLADRMIVTFNDITERKRAQTALHVSKERFERAMEASADGLFDWNLLTNDIYYSPGWKSMLGYEYDELPNDFSIWENLTDPKDVKRSWEMQQELINKQRDRFEIEFKMQHKNGHWVDILSRATAIFDKNDIAVRIVGTHIDITKRKQAEEALKRSEELLNQTGEMAMVGGWELDLKTNQVYWTHVTRLIHEVPPDYNPPLEEAINFFAPHSRPILTEAIRKAQEDGTPYDLELEFITAKGRKLWTRAIGKPVYENGECVMLRGTFQDITTRKQAEAIIIQNQQQLTTLTQRLFTLQEEERLRISRDLHDETGQVLSVVKIYLNLLETKISSASPELTDDLDKVKESLDTAHKQIRNLAASLRPSTLDLFGLSMSIEKLCEQIRSQTKIKIKLETEELPPIPNQAAIALYRIGQEGLNNILVHANAKNVKLTIKHQDDQIVLNIEDDGVGFDIASSSEKHGGLGILGMRERIHALGGTLTINTQPGKGTQLTAIYPLQGNN